MMEDAMDERRKVPRHRTLKAGHIAFNRAGTIDCRVGNLSPAGACLEVASQIGIPDRFVLVVETDHLQQPCHVIWRSATRGASASRPRPPDLTRKRRRVPGSHARTRATHGLII